MGCVMNYEYFMSLTSLTKKMVNDFFMQEKLLYSELRDVNSHEKVYSDADHCVLADL